MKQSNTRLPTTSVSHHHRNVVIHVLGNIAQETRSQDGNGTKSNTNIVHPLVRLRVSNLARSDHHFVCSLVASNARNRFQFCQQRGTSELDGLGDQFDIGNAELGHHRAADVVLGQRDELGDEDIVVNAVANASSYDTD